MTELLVIFKQPDYDIDEVVRLIRNDPPLTAEVLRRCNTAYFAGENPVADIFDAVSRLGFYEVYRIVVVISGSRTMLASSAAGGLRVEVLWQHSLVAGVAASVIAEAVNESAAAAFTAGLLHDVGKIVLASAGGEKYAELAQLPRVPGVPLVESEKRVFGFQHCEVGARLLERWSISEDVVAAIRHHHHPKKAGEFNRLAATISLADAFAHELDEQTTTETSDPENIGEIIELLNLAPGAVPAILKRIKLDLKKEAGLMAAM